MSGSRARRTRQPRPHLGAELVHLGDGAAALLPVAPDDAPAAVREGVARRRMALLDCRCPCGATFTPGSYQFAHDEACPGTDENLAQALWAWQSSS